MAKRNPRDESFAGKNAGSGGSEEASSEASGSGCRVLAITRDAGARGDVQRALEALGLRCDGVGTLAESRAALRSMRYDLVVVDELQSDGDGLELVRELSAHDGAARCIVTSERDGFEGMVEAMRCGAIDFVTKPYRAAELAGRVLAAAEMVRKLRASERRVQRLKRICKRLDTARKDMSRQVDDLCSDLVTAYQELADQMTHSALATEFSSLIRQDLDVEDLLRSTLEFVLSKTGPTNAAVFLPTGSRDFNLGAYVNYDVPRDTADVLLDHLADVIAPRFENESDLVRIETADELSERLGDEAGWLSDYGVLVFSCQHEGDCLAVVALFRDRDHPFHDELLPQIEVIRALFAEQLGRIVRIHHRHRPDERWPGFDVEDDRGLAA
ncbi:MAG: response regulator [Phycisphaerae bacterium]|nr:response regulator [Phycisphaerae bacterium]